MAQGRADRAASRGTGLVARIALVLLGAVLLESLGTYALYRWQERELLPHMEMRQIAAQLVSAADAAERTLPRDRASAVHALENEGLALGWVRRSMMTDHGPGSPRLAGLRARLVRHAPELASREMEFSLLPSGEGRKRDLLGLVRLKDGSFLSFRVQGYLNAPLPVWAILLLHVLLLCLVFGIALAMVHALVRPLARLAQAADETGRNHAARIEPSGPHEVRRVATAFAAMQARLLRMMEDNTQALIAVSHDLRTPIQRLRLRAGLVQDAEVHDGIQHDLQEMEHFIDSTLAYVRSGMDEPARLVDIAVLIATLVDDACDAGMDVHYRGPETFALHVRPAGLTRVLHNLIGNSRRYAGRIEVALDGEAGIRALIAVDDDGPGIPPEQRAACLLPFQGLDRPGGGDSGKGAGLGLSIVDRIVNAQGGTLALDTSRLGGLSVRIALPDIRVCPAFGTAGWCCKPPAQQGIGPPARPDTY